MQFDVYNLCFDVATLINIYIYTLIKKILLYLITEKKHLRKVTKAHISMLSQLVRRDVSMFGTDLVALHWLVEHVLSSHPRVWCVRAVVFFGFWQVDTVFEASYHCFRLFPDYREHIY